MGVPVFFLPIHQEAEILSWIRVPMPHTLWQLARLLRHERVKLIHSYTLDTRNYANAAALLTGCPLIHTSHDFWLGNEFTPMQWWAMNRIPERVIVISETVRWGLHVGIRLDPAQVVLINPGVDLVRFSPRDEGAGVRAEFGLAETTPLVGIVGRFNAEKGFDTFFAAAALVACRIPSARFLVVGRTTLPDDDEADVMRPMARLELQGRVILTGFRDDVPRLLAAMDVVVSASPRESYPTVLMEAAACGRPAVATRSGGAEEIVVDGDTGLLVPVNDALAMAEAITALLTNSAWATAMGQAARRRAEERFDLIRMVRQMEVEYHLVLERYGRKRGGHNLPRR
jgi:glycosyltransferase involved in cell wall biosynthesis